MNLGDLSRNNWLEKNLPNVEVDIFLDFSKKSRIELLGIIWDNREISIDLIKNDIILKIMGGKIYFYYKKLLVWEVDYTINKNKRDLFIWNIKSINSDISGINWYGEARKTLGFKIKWLGTFFYKKIIEEFSIKENQIETISGSIFNPQILSLTKRLIDEWYIESCHFEGEEDLDFWKIDVKSILFRSDLEYRPKNLIRNIYKNRKKPNI